MKKIFTIAMVAAAITALGHSAQAQQYVLHFPSADAPALADGDTVDYEPVDWEYQLGATQCSFYIESTLSSPVSTTQTVTVAQGPADMEIDLCAGGNCPWNGEPYDIVPGINENKPLTVEAPLGTGYTGTLVLKVVVGNADGLANATTAYLRMQLGSTGIGDVEGQAPVVAYPNPTTGKVNVGGRVYDLGGKPAGVYFLPAEGGMVRVIKN